LDSNFHHNTFVNVIGEGRGSGVYVGLNSTGNFVYNNLWFNCSNPKIYSTILHDYNAFFNSSGAISTESHILISSENPFVDSANYNFHLKTESSAIDAGNNLGEPYNFDAEGNIRGADGFWDIGAYEFHNS
jgi:hypothetical protein